MEVLLFLLLLLIVQYVIHFTNTYILLYYNVTLVYCSLKGLVL